MLVLILHFLGEIDNFGMSGPELPNLAEPEPIRKFGPQINANERQFFIPIRVYLRSFADNNQKRPEAKPR